LENEFFVGVTSPSEAVNKMIEGLALMKAEILDRTVDFVVVNTDGWIEGKRLWSINHNWLRCLNQTWFYLFSRKTS